MKRLVEVFLGVLTAIGGFVDIGELVTASAVGARFDMTLAWATVASLLGIMLFAEMAGRVAAVSQRPVFDLVRERLGARAALVNLVASLVVTLATLAAEIAGVALSLQLATAVNYLLWIPLVALFVWLVIWKFNFTLLENLFGLLGLALLVTVVGVVHLSPAWGHVAHQATHPFVPATEGPAMYFYFAIAMFGAGLMPYEVFFFSSGAIEEGWGRRDVVQARANVFVGFPLGALVTLSLMLGASLVLSPRGIEVTRLFQSALPTTLALGRVGLAVAILGFVACTFGAALETAMACSYSLAQYLGWQWGKMVTPRQDARFHVVTMLFVGSAMLVGLTTVDPVKLTEYVVVFSAAALPLTYLPVLVVANDPVYMGDRTNGWFANLAGTAFLVVVLVVSVVTVPLMIVTKGGG